MYMHVHVYIHINMYIYIFTCTTCVCTCTNYYKITSSTIVDNFLGDRLPGDGGGKKGGREGEGEAKKTVGCKTGTAKGNDGRKGKEGREGGGGFADARLSLREGRVSLCLSVASQAKLQPGLLE